MNRDEFIEAYYKTAKRALFIADKVRKMGFLSVEEDLDREKFQKRDVFEYGLRFVIDGTDRDVIDDLLSNIVNQEKDEYLRLLKTMQKKAVLLIQDGSSPIIVFAFMNSYTDLSLKEDESEKVLDELGNLKYIPAEDNIDKEEEEKNG